MKHVVRGFGVWLGVVGLLCAMLSSVVDAVPSPPGTTNLGSDSFSQNNVIFYNPSNDKKITGRLGLSNGMVNHLLIRSDHGIAKSIRLGVYYNSGVSGDQYLDIIGNYPTCTGFPNSSQAAVTFTANGTVIRSVRSSDMCGPLSAFYASNVRIPASVIAGALDSGIGKRVITLDIAYTDFINTLPLSTDRTVSFKVNAITGGGIIGTKDTIGAAANNSIVGKNAGGSGNLKVIYPFGLRCNGPNDVNDTVTLYDADNKVSGQSGYLMYFSVQKLVGNSWLTLRENDYDLSSVEDTTTVGRGLGANPVVWFIPGDGNLNVKASVLVKHLMIDTKYRMIVDQLHKIDDTPGHNNYIYVGLPGDGIFGAQNFKCPEPYNLNPGVSLSSLTAEAGASINVTPSVSNSGTPTDNHAWSLDVVKYGRGQGDTPTNVATLPTNGSSTLCVPQYQPRIACPTVQSGSANFPAGSTNPAGGDVPFPIPDTDDVGTKYCFVMSVKDPVSPPNGTWKHSARQCVVVGIKPKLQVWGYDLRATGQITTSTSTLSNLKTYGSSAEYGLFSNGINKGMASGSGLIGGNLSNSQSDWSFLTFANFPSPTFGNYGGVAPPSDNAGTPGAGDMVLPNPGGVCTLGVSLPYVGGQKLIRCNGTLVITANQTYGNGPYDKITDIPSAKISADDIVIDSAVTTIDPWLIALKNDGTFGRVSTCKLATDFQDFATVRLTSSMCQNRITFNGPVITGKLYPYRTYGTSTGDPAEVFNFRASNFLSAYAGYGTGQPTAWTDVLTDLPPRF